MVFLQSRRGMRTNASPDPEPRTESPRPLPLLDVPRRGLPVRGSGSLLQVALLALPLAAQEARVGYLFSDGQMPGAVAAYRQLLEERPELRDRVELRFLTESVFDDPDSSDLADVDVLVFDIMNQQMLERFDERHETDLIAGVSRRGHVLAVGEGLLPKEHYTSRNIVWDERARAFWAHSGPTNQLGLLKLALDRAGIEGLDIPDPEPSLEFGYYLPNDEGGRVFATWEQFDESRTKMGGPRIAVGFYKSSYYGGDTDVLDAVIAEIEHQGGEAIPLFGYPAHTAFERLLVDSQGKARAGAALALFFRFAQPESSKTLEQVGIPIFNLATLYGRSEQQWRNSRTGLSVFEGTFQVAAPEFAGLLAPMVVGSKERVDDPASGLRVVINRPIAERVEMAVRRARRYVTLREKPNRDKRLALLYYNYPAGKASIGASYLNVAESLANVLKRLRREGYDVGERKIDSDSVLDAIKTAGRNVAGYAPGELDRLLESGAAVRLPINRYREWLADLSPNLRRKIFDDWGAPEDAEVMTAGGAFIIPALRWGNIVLMPQPARGWGEDLDQLYHADDLAPHHQYVAAYAWLRHEFGADAVIHVGTHGTLEWLDGKAAGLSSDDAPDALIADLPDLYIYNVDVVGEGLVARRRGAAALVDHMTPPFRKGGLYAELAKLSETIDDHDLNLGKNPQLAAIYAQEIRQQAIDLGIAKDLSLDFAEKGSLEHEQIHQIQAYLRGLKSENIPYGLHAFGRTPQPEYRRSTVDAIVSIDRSLLPDQRDVLSTEMERRIVASGPRELDNLMRGLAGRYLPGGNGGEPIRNPDVYPTGKNFYGIDPDKIPKKAAYDLGVKLAEQMLAEHRAEHGRYPEKVSFVIWGDETMRHEGVLESQIFHLLGTRPVWDARGNVTDVEVIPSRQLGRPRIDIVIASAAEGMFYNVTQLMDKAVQLVKVIEEADNLVRRNYLATRKALVAKGYSQRQADLQASVRIFDEPPGVFNLNTSRIVEASGSWDTDAGMANDYMKKMGHGYGNGFWGEPMEDAFRLALSGTEKVVHSSSTMLYGALDNDDFYMYMGGLATAVRNLDGESPELVITNTRNPEDPKMTSIDEFLGTEFRSRYVNPNWIRGMQKEGYAGAREMRAFVEHLWGWDATVSDTVDDAMWQETYQVYVEDKHGLQMDAFFEGASPHAFQDMTARMLETVRKGYWQADDATRTRLLAEYLSSVEEHGVSCSDHTCGNPRFLEYVGREARDFGIPAPVIESFEAAMNQALGRAIDELSAEAREFVEANEARIARRQRQSAAGRAPSDIEGYQMEPVDTSEEPSNGRSLDLSETLGSVLFGAAVLALLLRWRHSHGTGA